MLESLYDIVLYYYFWRVNICHISVPAIGKKNFLSQSNGLSE